MSAIELKSVRKSFQNLEVIHGIDLVIEEGSFTVFVGPSGCGKSTLLRMMAGLEEVSGGQVHIDGARCDHLLPSARGMAMVFQSYALYPHMSVAENLRFGLENQRLERREIDARVAKAANILQIEHLLARRPNQLSGGQSQRVAIGRAIVKEPKAFLFDEPLSNLDAELRVKMRGELISLHKRLKSTMIYVTHDQVEAMTMADTIVVLNGGNIEQVGSPVELYVRPVNAFVAKFLGAPPMNMLGGKVEKNSGSVAVVLGDGTRVPLAQRLIDVEDGDPVTLGIRPEHLLASDGPFQMKVETTEVLGSQTIVHSLLASGESFTAALPGIRDIKSGDDLRMGCNEAFLHLFNQEGFAIGASADWKSAYLA